MSAAVATRSQQQNPISSTTSASTSSSSMGTSSPVDKKRSLQKTEGSYRSRLSLHLPPCRCCPSPFTARALPPRVFRRSSQGKGIMTSVFHLVLIDPPTHTTVQYNHPCQPSLSQSSSSLSFSSPSMRVTSCIPVLIFTLHNQKRPQRTRPRSQVRSQVRRLTRRRRLHGRVCVYVVPILTTSMATDVEVDVQRADRLRL